MTAHTAPDPLGLSDWQAGNQRHLGAALGRVHDALARYLAPDNSGRITSDPPTTGVGDSASPTPDEHGRHGRAWALDVVAAKFGLSRFEQDVLVLCAGVELESRIASLCAKANGDPQRRYATFGLALAAVPGAHWSATTPTAPLRRWRLVSLTAESEPTSSPLRIDERILHFLAGAAYLDERLAAVATSVGEHGQVAATHRALVERITAVLTASRRQGPVPVVQLLGPRVSDTRSIAAVACRAVGLRILAIPASAIPVGASELDLFERLCERECALSDCALLIDFGDDDDAEAARAVPVERFLERTSAVLLLTGGARRRTGRRASVALEVPRPNAADQRLAWTEALGAAAAARLNGHVEVLVSQFSLSTHGIRAVAADVLAQPVARDDDQFSRDVWEGCRLQARPRLDGLCDRVESTATWDDLVLPAAQRQILRDIVTHVRHRATVYDQWGFGDRRARGLGVTALFAGASGTGKTMAAEVIGNELRLDVYRIDLSAVVSKYIGETEKNLRRIFDAAEEGGVVLLFDEADALFGKRSEVKDSHDRYANIEVSYLLQRMENYRGLAVLTTNLKSALDTAFLRRIRFVVQFPFPDVDERAEIWRRIFPTMTPTEGLRPERLAQLVVPGGNIKSIALNAAFLAADAQEPVRMSHLLRAARSEYAKLEKPLTEAEIADWGNTDLERRAVV